MLAVKLFVTASLFAVLFWHADWIAMEAALSGADKGWLAIALALQAISFLIVGIRWWWVLVTLDPDLKMSQVARPIAVGLFANNFMPGGTGLDVARLLLVGDRLSRGQVGAAVVLERAIGLSSVICIGAVALLFAPENLRQHVPWWVPIAILGSVFCGAAMALSPIGTSILRALARLKLWLPTERFFDALATLLRHRSRIMAAAMFTLVLQAAVVFAFWATGKTVAMGADVSFFFVAVPLVFLAASVPLSLGGLGVREATFVGLAIAAGLDSDLALIVSLLFLIEVWILTLPGGLALLRAQREGNASHARSSRKHAPPPDA